METGRGVAEERQGVTSATGHIADSGLEETPGGETWGEVTGSITSPVDSVVSHDVHTYAYATVRIFGAKRKSVLLRVEVCTSLQNEMGN